MHRHFPPSLHCNSYIEMRFRECVFTGGAEVAKCIITDNNVTLCVLDAILHFRSRKWKKG